jgi:hypothetical protein
LPAPPHRVSRAPFASMPPTTQNLRRRDGRADRRQTPVLTLTAQCLRRRRGFTASVFGRVPRAIGHPSHYSFSAAPHRVMPDKGRRSCLYQSQRMRKRGNFEKSPVSSMDFGTMRRQDFSRKSGIYRSSSIPMAIWNFYARVPMAAHGGARYSSPHPPGHSSRRADSFARGGGEIARPRNCCIGSKALWRRKRPTPPARPFAPGPKRKACCWSRGKTSAPKRDEAPSPRLRSGEGEDRLVPKAYLRSRIAAIALTWLRA